MRSRSRWYRFVWPELIVLPIALIIAGGVCAFWLIGDLSLAGYPHQRFDSAMAHGTINAEVVLVLPIWLFLRAADIGVRILSRLFRTDPRRSGSGGLRSAS